MSVPSTPIALVVKSIKNIFPAVHQELDYWRKRAAEIPNEELRRQALASIEKKKFHCEGGSILSLLADSKYKKIIPFIVAYQTISDYLDNLCDRSNSLDPEDFAALHESMMQAITVGAAKTDYYRNRRDRDDGEYLEELVTVCQNTLKEIPNYYLIKDVLIELCSYYCDLQIHKHVKVEERIPRLKNWFAENQKHVPNMEWYEFSACSGSTLGIFCLVSYAVRDDFSESYVPAIRNGYFPYIQGLHILLDYLIDQEEDREGGDLNFCTYYENQETLLERLKMFVNEADRQTAKLPNRKFHQLINRGLIGLYLSDSKIKTQEAVQNIAKNLMKVGGMTSYFFYFNIKAYKKWQSATN